MRRLHGLLGILCLLAPLPGTAAVPPPDPPEVLAERDALVDKIAQGEDTDASIERFAALFRAHAGQKQAFQAAQEREVALQKSLSEYRRSADYVAGEHCALNADPQHPEWRGETDAWRTDWGKVVRKETVRLAPKNAFDEGEEITLYLIAGAQKTYTMTGKGPSYPIGKPLSAKVGDLVFLCMMAMESHGSGSPYPPDFRDNIVSQGFALPLRSPPRVVDKKRWNPLHIVGAARLRMAITRVEWHYPEDRNYLHHMLVEREWTDAPVPPPPGITRYLITAERESYVLEVPAGLKNRELLQPGRYVWAIMNKPRFDKALRKLVLAAEDLEAQYIFPAE